MSSRWTFTAALQASVLCVSARFAIRGFARFHSPLEAIGSPFHGPLRLAPANLGLRPAGHPWPRRASRPSGRRSHLRAAAFMRIPAASVAIAHPWTAQARPCQSSGVGNRAQQGLRSEVSSERPEGRMPEGSVRRDGRGEPELARTAPGGSRKDGGPMRTVDRSGASCRHTRATCLRSASPPGLSAGSTSRGVRSRSSWRAKLPLGANVARSCRSCGPRGPAAAAASPNLQAA
jgi:hypothetical protein